MTWDSELSFYSDFWRSVSSATGWLVDLLGVATRTITPVWGAVMGNGAWFGAGNRDWSYRGREIGESVGVLRSGEIATVLLGAWIGD